MTINLSRAAKYYKEESHQIAAWNWLESILSDDQLDEFAELYRAGPANPSGNIITPEIMQQLTGYQASKFDATFCGDFNKLLLMTGFDQHKDAMCMLIANLSHETGNYRWMKEIADGTAYNNRSDLGNGPNDGPKYKGAGVLMLTGKYNYTRAAAELQDPLIVERGCDYVADHYPFRSALCWIKDNDLLGICLGKGFDECCYRINGGFNGYEDRKEKYEITKKVFGVS
jgi:predicted chitinase